MASLIPLLSMMEQSLAISISFWSSLLISYSFERLATFRVHKSLVSAWKSHTILFFEVSFSASYFLLIQKREQLQSFRHTFVLDTIFDSIADWDKVSQELNLGGDNSLVWWF